MSSFVPVLKQSDIFHQFTPKQLEMVANLCHEKVFQAGEIVFDENSESSELYIIADGEVELRIDPSLFQVPDTHSANLSVKNTLTKGQTLGEVALVDEGLRSASARVMKDETRLLAIDRSRLIMLCETYPPLGFRLMYNLAVDLAMVIRNTDLRMHENV